MSPTNSSTSVGRSSETEGVNVRLHVLGVDPNGSHALSEQLRLMQTLSTTEYLLSTHEEVVRVGESLQESSL
jgi:hypothetical protein